MASSQNGNEGKETVVTMFNDTTEKANIWIKSLQEKLHLPRKEDAYKLLKVVLHEIRDRLPVSEAAQLGAQLPLLIRGLYYEGFSPQTRPSADKSLKSLLQTVEQKMPRFYPKDSGEMVRGVLALISEHVSEGEIRDVKACCPEELRDFWPSIQKRKETA